MSDSSVEYSAPYYLEQRGIGENTLLDVLKGRDQKHGGRIEAVLTKLAEKNKVINNKDKISLPEDVDKLRWIDIGAGTAPIARVVKEQNSNIFDIYSFDMSSAGISLVPSNETPPFVVGDVNSLPLASQSADILTAHDILEHLEEPKIAMQEAYRVLKSEGLFHIVVPNPTSETYKTDPTHVLPPVVTIKYFKEVIPQIGFRNMEVVTRGFPESGEYFKKHKKELFKPEGGNHIYVFAWK